MPGPLSEPPPPLVLHVLHHLVIGGMENGLVNLINHLPRGAYRHAVLCIEDYSEFRDRIQNPAVEVVALRRSRIGLWRMRRDIHAHCRRLRPALLHTRAMSGLDALLPARLAGVRHAVHSEHGWNVDNLRGQALKPRLLRRLHAPLVDRYITVSRDLERFLVGDVGIDARRIEHIVNGVDTDRFQPPHAGADLRWLPDHFRSPAQLRVGTVGRLQAVKDQASLLRAFAAARGGSSALRERLRLVIAGDGPLLGDLRALAAALDLGDDCHFAGAVTDVPQLLQGLDVFVLPSLNEGISNTILEAMAVGLPVLASAVGGNVELVTDGVDGSLFPAADVAALAALLQLHAGDPALRRARGAAARQAAVDCFSLQAMVARYRSVYDRVLAGSDRRAPSAGAACRKS